MGRHAVKWVVLYLAILMGGVGCALLLGAVFADINPVLAAVVIVGGIIGYLTFQLLDGDEQIL